jgi:hypothetical protein
MHRDLMREIMNQRVVERQEEARKITVVRELRKAMRRHDRAETPDVLLQPIPDYVDGTFRSGELPAGRVGAARK